MAAKGAAQVIDLTAEDAGYVELVTPAGHVRVWPRMVTREGAQCVVVEVDANTDYRQVTGTGNWDVTTRDYFASPGRLEVVLTRTGDGT